MDGVDDDRQSLIEPLAVHAPKLTHVLQVVRYGHVQIKGHGRGEVSDVAPSVQGVRNDVVTWAGKLPNRSFDYLSTFWSMTVLACSHQGQRSY